MMREIKGIIEKGIGGFYYVRTQNKDLVECKARGLFRKERITPLAGDSVILLEGEEQSYTIHEILPRKNQLVRPPIANLDQLMIVISVCDPNPNMLVIDKLIAASEAQKIQPILIFTKSDLQSTKSLTDVYSNVGIPYFEVSSSKKIGVEPIKPLLKGKLTALTGNTGVGKSSLLNQLLPGENLETGEISRKLGRGRHTTRQVELLPVPGGGYVADTPGFSSIQLERYVPVKKEELQYCFREFIPYIDQCQFQGCSHVCEKGCAVLKAMKDGKISESRHQSYCEMYEQIKEIKDWERK